MSSLVYLIILRRLERLARRLESESSKVFERKQLNFHPHLLLKQSLPQPHLRPPLVFPSPLQLMDSCLLPLEELQPSWQVLTSTQSRQR